MKPALAWGTALVLMISCPSWSWADTDVAGRSLCKDKFQEYQDRLTKNLDDNQAWTEFRVCVVELKRWQEGSNVASAALDKRQDLWQAFLVAGISDLHLKEYSKASDEFQKSADLKSDNSTPFYYLGMAQLFLKNPEGAVQAGEKAVSLEPNNSANYRQLAFAYLFTDQREECETAAKKALAIDPNDSSAYKVLAQLYEKEGKQADSDKMMDEAIHANGRLAAAHPFTPDKKEPVPLSSLPGLSPGPGMASHTTHVLPPIAAETAPPPPPPEDIDSPIDFCKGQWSKMNDAVQRGDLETAVSYFSDFGETREKYRQSFEKLGTSRVQQIFSSFGELDKCSRVIGSVTCKAELTHPGQPGTMISTETTVRFERNESDGVWRIQSF